MRVKATLTKLSICPCGFPALRDGIPLGAEYEVDPECKKPFVWTCGGCKNEFFVEGVYVYNDKGGRPGYLPAELFTWDGKGMNEPQSTYEISFLLGATFIKCLGCGAVSYNRSDVEQHYCGRCHIFRDDLWPPARQWFLDNAKKIAARSKIADNL